MYICTYIYIYIYVDIWPTTKSLDFLMAWEDKPFRVHVRIDVCPNPLFWGHLDLRQRRCISVFWVTFGVVFRSISGSKARQKTHLFGVHV